MDLFSFYQSGRDVLVKLDWRENRVYRSSGLWERWGEDSEITLSARYHALTTSRSQRVIKQCLEPFVCYIMVNNQQCICIKLHQNAKKKERSNYLTIQTLILSEFECRNR